MYIYIYIYFFVYGNHARSFLPFLGPSPFPPMFSQKMAKSPSPLEVVLFSEISPRLPGL